VQSRERKVESLPKKESRESRSVGYVISKKQQRKCEEEEVEKKLNFLHFSTVNSLSDYSIRASEWGGNVEK